MNTTRTRVFSKGSLVLGLLLFAAALPAQAQTVSFEVPQEVRIAPGLLSVVFVDGVAESDAVDWLRGAGYETVRATFSEVVARVQSSEPFPEARVAALRDHVDVVWAEPLRTQQGIWQLRVRLAPTLSPDAAQALIRERIGLTPFEVVKIPNDVEIRVPEGEEELALEAIEASDRVSYVTYVAALE